MTRALTRERSAFATRRGRPVRGAAAFWVRELLSLTRNPRTARLMTTVALVLAASLGLVSTFAGTFAEPADVGWTLYQTYFSLGFWFVTWAGPNITAATIAAERQTGMITFLQLTPLSPRALSWGRFLAAMSHVGTYLLLLAPFSTVPLVFGGVTLLEVVLGHACLLVFAALAVSLALAISTLWERGARSITMVASTLAAAGMYLGFGFALSAAAHYAWPEAPTAVPVWLPSALCRVPITGRVLATLVYAPVVLSFSILWFFHELAVMHTTPAQANRTLGLRCWLAVTFPLLLAVAEIPRLWAPVGPLRWSVHTATSMGICVHVVLSALLLAADPPEPTQRHWLPLRRASRALKFIFHPGLGRGLGTLMALATVGLATVAVSAATDAMWAQGPQVTEALASRNLVFAVVGYGFAFTCFLLALTYTLRCRGLAPDRTRTVVLSVSTLIGLLPIPLSAVLFPWPKVLPFWILAPSPSYVFLAAEGFAASPPRPDVLGAGGVAVAGWLIASATLLAVARKARRRGQTRPAGSEP